MTSIEFLGHIFDVSGVRLSDARVKEIQELPEPTSVKGVRSFIGMVNYFRDFIKGLSSYMILLTALTQRRVRLRSLKILAPYLLGKLFTVRTDHRNLVYLVS